MSLILKGIDLPKMGDELVIYICSDGLVGDEKYGTLIKDAEAIQIPKNHGRLIDGDELKAKREWMRWRENNSTHEAEFVNSKYIDNAPTILEAEEE